MKIIITSILFLILSGLFVVNERLEKRLNKNIPESEKVIESNPSIPDSKLKISYSIETILDEKKKILKTREWIKWYNQTDNPTNEIHFHLYPNGFKNNKTLLAKRVVINEASKTELEIKEFLINNKKSELIYYQPEIKNPFDSIVAKVKLDRYI